jgi:hypothetical protein
MAGQGEKVRYTTSQRGAQKAIHGGFLYTKHRTGQDGVSWRCDQTGKCLGRITARIVRRYEHYKNDDDVVSYSCLRAVGNNIAGNI